MRRARCSDLPRLVVATAARTVLWTAALVAGWAVVAALVGAEVTTVASDSMAPAIRAGDVVAAVGPPADGPRTGQVLLVEDPDRPDRLRLHRLVEVEADGLRLRGDANDHPDASLVGSSAVHGVGVLRFPAVGLPGLWLRGGDWTLLAAALAGAAVLVALGSIDRVARSGAPCAGCGAPREILTVLGRRRPGRRVVLSVVAVATAVTLAGTAVDAGATFSGVTDGRGRVSSAGFACYRDHPTDDAVLAWDFDEAGGDVVDRSGNGNTAELIDGARRTDGTCVDHPAMGFDGEASRAVSTKRTGAATTFTMEAWFRTDEARGQVLGFSTDRTPASAIKSRTLYVSPTGTVLFGVQGAGNGFKFRTGSSRTVTDGRWHHVVGTYRPGLMRLWLDGELQSSRTDNRSPETTSGYWRVGRESLAGWGDSAYPYDFAGQVDHVRVYDRELTDDEITGHHAAGR